MKEIFTDLYKKVLGFFQAEEKESSESKDIAVNRMKLVLMQDRTNLTPYLLERMRGEMIEVLAKYVEMDKDALELNFEQEGEQMALMLSIPVVRAKDEEEIQAILDAEDQQKALEETEADEEEDLDTEENESQEEEVLEEEIQEEIEEDSEEEETLEEEEDSTEERKTKKKKKK